MQRRDRVGRALSGNCSRSSARGTTTSRTSTSRFPLGTFTAVTGVSGRARARSSTTCSTTRSPASCTAPSTAGAAHDEIRGLEHIDKVIRVDQEPLGNTPTSNPATYTGVFDLIRELFAQLPEAKVRGYHPRRFSFNEPGGRCEACEGKGQKRIEMHFLPDVWVECDTCRGRRYNPETLAVRYHGKSIADVLTMRVGEAVELFGNIPKIRRDSADARRRRARLPGARPAGADALRRRGPAREAGGRAGAAQHRPDALPARRADDRACTSTTSASCSTC